MVVLDIWLQANKQWGLVAYSATRSYHATITLPISFTKAYTIIPGVRGTDEIVTTLTSLAGAFFAKQQLNKFDAQTSIYASYDLLNGLSWVAIGF